MKARMLWSKALDVLQGHILPHGLTDQQAVAKLHSLLDGADNGERGTVPQLLKLARQVLRRNNENAITDHEAMNEMYGILDGPEAYLMPEITPEQGDEEEEPCLIGKR